jgi:hypothetical protein
MDTVVALSEGSSAANRRVHTRILMFYEEIKALRE